MADYTLAFSGVVIDAALAASPKARINFDGNGTVAIREAANVTSLTDNGTGDYTLNFTSNFANNDYAVVGAAGNASPSSGNPIFVAPAATDGFYVTSSVRVFHRFGNIPGSAGDAGYVHVSTAGTLA